jgi:hypothetical protein
MTVLPVPLGMAGYSLGVLLLAEETVILAFMLSPSAVVGGYLVVGMPSALSALMMSRFDASSRSLRLGIGTCLGAACGATLSLLGSSWAHLALLGALVGMSSTGIVDLVVPVEKRVR